MRERAREVLVSLSGIVYLLNKPTAETASPDTPCLSNPVRISISKWALGSTSIQFGSSPFLLNWRNLVHTDIYIGLK